MSTIKGTLVLAGVVGAAGYAAYRLLLDDKARQSLTEAMRTVSGAYGAIRDRVEDLRGVVVEDDDQPLANRQAAEQAWARLGY